MFVCPPFVTAAFRLRAGRVDLAVANEHSGHYTAGLAHSTKKSVTAGSFYIPLCIEIYVRGLWWSGKKYRERPKSSGLGGVGSCLVVEGAV